VIKTQKRKPLSTLFSLLISLLFACFLYGSNDSIQTGEKFQKAGNFEEALSQFRIAQKIAKQTSQREAECEASMKTGLMLWNLGSLPLSLNEYDRALNSANELKLTEKIDVIQTIKKIFQLYSDGKALRSSGEYEKSINSFQQAVELSLQIHSPEFKLKCLRQMSLTFHAANKLDDFKKLNEQALTIASTLNGYRHTIK